MPDLGRTPLVELRRILLSKMDEAGISNPDSLLRSAYECAITDRDYAEAYASTDIGRS